ncbi:hypothetical protein K3177_14815 [Qipengyuania sp. GH25]|uniref:DUF4345 domain-containing protein n=1 Tax=Qipengyuania pacifica TaxID=2860199 RepID=A0ABS7JK73_9SPHN|nr:hypothetical protein [Qipengyuania aerophila]MBX7489778.1 hypothetical protein [Qipengyuania aerophila]
MPFLNRLMMCILAAGMLANGVCMLANPAWWYFHVPTVTGTGPYNQHFVRDIGLVYVLIGAGYAFGVVSLSHRLWAWAAATTWLVGHALFHLWEIGTGLCGSDTILRNWHGVYLPAVMGIVGVAIETTSRRLPSRAERASKVITDQKVDL